MNVVRHIFIADRIRSSPPTRAVSDTDFGGEKVASQPARCCTELTVSGNFQRRDAATERACCTQDLCRRFLPLCVQNEPRRRQAHEFVTSRSEFAVKALVGQVKDTSQIATHRKNQIGISWGSLQLSISSGEEGFDFEHGGHLAISAVKNGKAIWAL